MTGRRVSAPRPDPIILSEIRSPKYWRGTISEKRRTRNPADTDVTLITIAFPLMPMVFASACETGSPLTLELLNPVITWIE